MLLVPPNELKIKEEPQPPEAPPPIHPVITATEPVRVINSDVIKQKLDHRVKGQRESMISIRKDYSDKFQRPPMAASNVLDHAYENVSPSIASPTLHSSMPSSKLEMKKKEKFMKPLLSTAVTNGKASDPTKRSMPSITILERHCYEKGPSLPKQIKVEPAEESLFYAIQTSQPFSSSTHCSNNSNVPIKQSGDADNSQITMGLDEFEVTVAQKADKSDTKPKVQSFKSQAEPKDSQNINRVNNNINIIFKLGSDNAKSLRKNIILHRRTPKFQKITIKDKNSSSVKTQPDGVLLSSSSIDTQTEIVQRCAMNISTSKPLSDEPTGKLEMRKNDCTDIDRPFFLQNTSFSRETFSSACKR